MPLLPLALSRDLSRQRASFLGSPSPPECNSSASADELKFLRMRRDRERLSKVSSIPGHRRRRALYPPRRGRCAKGEMQRRNFVGLFQAVLVVGSLPLLTLSLSLSFPFPITLAKALLLSFYLCASLSPAALTLSFRRSRSFARLSGQIDFS